MKQWHQATNLWHYLFMFCCSWAGSLSIPNNIMEKYANTDVCLHQLPSFPSPLYASLPEKWTRCLILALAQAVTPPSLGCSLNGTQSVDPSSHNLMFVKVPEQTSTEQLRVKDVWGDRHREGENEVTSSQCKLYLQQILKTGRCLGLSPVSSSMFWARTV